MIDDFCTCICRAGDVVLKWGGQRLEMFLAVPAGRESSGSGAAGL